MENEKNELKNEIKNLNEEIKKIKLIIENNKNKEIKDEIKNIKEEIKRMNIILESNNKYIEELKNEQKRIKEEQKKKEKGKKIEEERLIYKINHFLNLFTSMIALLMICPQAREVDRCPYFRTASSRPGG